MHESSEPDHETDGPSEVVWLHDCRQDGVVTYRMGRQGRSLVAEWPRVARLTCDENGRRVRLTPKDGSDRSSLAKLQGVVKVMLGDLRGGIGLHASALAMGSRAVLLLGDSGAGKSTAAAELCLRHGARLMADDAALLEVRRGVVFVVPSEDRHYLTEDSARALGVKLPATRTSNGKGSVRPIRSGARGYRLALVVSLRYDDALDRAVCRRLTGIDAAMRLLPAMFRFDVDNRRRELDRLTTVYEQAPVLELARPRNNPDVTAPILLALEEQHRG
jgi:hypothetical protein